MRQKKVFAPTTETLFPGVIEGVIYDLLKVTFYNGEHWYHVKDLSGNIFHSPAVFFESLESN